MPQIVKYVDKIARERNRDVLFVWFEYPHRGQREKISNWLRQEEIPFEVCGDFARHDTFFSEERHLYIDLVNDPNDPAFQKVSDYFEDSKGESRISGVKFYLLTLDCALKNLHHDDQRFWDDLIENL